MQRHDLGLLASLDVLLEEGNVTRAAQRLHITQPALSAQLARLRKTFGDALLVPAERGRGLVLTPRAKALQGPLRARLGELDALVGSPPRFDPSSAQCDFHIATNDNAASMVGLELIERVRAQAPGIRLALYQVDAARAFELAARGELDLVVGSAAAIPAGMRSQLLLRDRFRVAQRKQHPRGTGRMGLRQYCALPHVIVSSQGGFRSAIDDVLASRGLQRRVALSVQYYAMVPTLLQRSDWIATLPARFLAQFSVQLDTFALPLVQNEIQLCMGWHPRHESDPGHAWLREQLVCVAGQVRQTSS